MNLFVVFKEGGYRHECGRIFTTFETAVDAAKFLAEGDRDSYHKYKVVPFVLDETTHQTTGEEVLLAANGHPYRQEKGTLIEEGVLFTCRKPT